MPASSKEIVEQAYAAWAARDLAGALACAADDIEFIMHLPSDVVPFAGPMRGREALAQNLQTVLDEFDFLAYEPVQITAQGLSFHSQVRFHYRHKATGLDYDGTMRHTWFVENGKIVRWEEFHDVERVRAYFKLLAQRLSGA